jgi:hypothetical protein
VGGSWTRLGHRLSPLVLRSQITFPCHARKLLIFVKLPNLSLLSLAFPGFLQAFSSACDISKSFRVASPLLRGIDLRATNAICH